MKTITSHTDTHATTKKKMPSSHTENLLRLYEDDLKDIYWAEKHLLKVLPKMAKASSSEELKQALDDHLAQTEHHVTRLEKVFAASGLVAGSKKCEGIEGLTKEGERVIEAHEKGSVRDAGLLSRHKKLSTMKLWHTVHCERSPMSWIWTARRRFFRILWMRKVNPTEFSRISPEQSTRRRISISPK